MMDTTQILAFAEYLIGWRELGTTENEIVQTPNSPEVRAFVLARLGAKCPTAGYSLVWSYNKENAQALAGFLREVADGLDAFHPEKVA